jgi:hypothetical protein
MREPGSLQACHLVPCRTVALELDDWIITLVAHNAIYLLSKVEGGVHKALL